MPLKDVEHNFSTQNNPLQISTDQINCNTTPSHELASDRGLDASTSSDHSSSSIQIDLNRLHESLDHVNQYSKRRLNDKLPSVLMYEIDSTGHSCYKSISLRELLNYVNAESNSIDEAALAQFVTFEGGSNFDTVHPNEAGGVCSPRHQQEQHDQIQQSLRLDVYSNLRRSSTSADNLPAFGAASHSAFPASVSGTAAGLPDLQGRRRGPAAAPIQRGLGSTRSVYDMRYSPTDATKVGIGFPPRSTGPITPTLPPVPDQTYEAIGALRLRDLRRLDFQFNPNEERSVLIRRHAVLFAMVTAMHFSWSWE